LGGGNAEETDADDRREGKKFSHSFLLGVYSKQHTFFKVANGSLLILHFFPGSKHLSDLRRCLSTNVVTTAFKFGERVAFEFFQRFLAQCHNPKLGQPCTIGCVGHHKKPENIGLSRRPGLAKFLF
jgi:hypothetical protein